MAPSLVENPKGPSALVATLQEQFTPSSEWMGLVRSTVVALQFYSNLQLLNPPSGLEMVVGLLVQPWPVVDRAVEHANVDVVKVVFLPRPVVGGIIDLEADVGRNKGRLDGREVGTDDFSGRIGLCEINGPDTYRRKRNRE